MQYLLLLILWVTWCALHSALISLSVTESLRKRFPNAFRYYRILYNLFAVVTILPVLFYTFSQRGESIVTWNGPWRIVPILLGTVALFFFVAGARRYDFFQLLGLRQFKDENELTMLS
jgi:predicted Na+-dependent transporter